MCVRVMEVFKGQLPACRIVVVMWRSGSATASRLPSANFNLTSLVQSTDKLTYRIKLVHSIPGLLRLHHPASGNYTNPPSQLPYQSCQYHHRYTL